MLFLYLKKDIKMKKSCLSLLILLLITLSVQSQKLESYQLIESYSPSDIADLIGLNVPYGVDLYKVRYNTADARGSEHVASGLLCIPQVGGGTILPMACYQHGTVAGREDVPSKLAGGFTLALVFSSFGYAVCAPDYVGLGDSPGIHPYVHAETEASAGVDMIYALQEIDNQDDNILLNDQLFITGYSQGGHAAMAAHRSFELEHADDFTVTGSAPMSGPYSLSEAMRDFTLGDDEYFTVAYLGWSTLSFIEAESDLFPDVELADFFKPAYIADVEAFRDETIDLWELNRRMIAELQVTEGKVIPKKVFLDSVVDDLFNNPDNALAKALKRNDTYDWAPKAPTKLFYCMGDDQVTYKNALIAAAKMEENGSTSVEAVRKDTDSNLLDHGGCVLPATLDAIIWFNSLRGNLMISTSVNDIDDTGNVSVTFTDNILTIDYAIGDHQGLEMNIINLSGISALNHMVSTGRSTHDLSQLTKGIYIVTLKGFNNELRSYKIAIH